jgi:hypothetical protein
MRPEGVADCVSKPRRPASGAAAEVAWVFVKKRRKYGLCHVIGDDQIAIGGAEISAEAGGPWPKERFALVHWL